MTSSVTRPAFTRGNSFTLNSLITDDMVVLPRRFNIVSKPNSTAFLLRAFIDPLKAAHSERHRIEQKADTIATQAQSPQAQTVRAVTVTDISGDISQLSFWTLAHSIGAADSERVIGANLRELIHPS